MSKGYWLPATVTRWHEDVTFLFETLIYGVEVERPDYVDQETAERWLKDDLAALQGVRRYRHEAHGYDILMETLTADPALDVEERLLAKQKQILEMAYRAKELCDEHRAQEEEAEEDEEDEE